ncbi:hypothetical protein OG401_14170 [Kitasatospora purpeofusca]|uniref:hypothetical protein n=1 Tax=Kitasatospora purpeofusca TaxID=67352 RepID=UPI00225B2814|nr:hypothetical protein [Kitasatospora purpeofusca]MCX4685447.1 hypothetical protein [Kitasatospora purpeofusca]
MSENPDNAFSEILSEIEADFNQALFERRLIAAAQAAEATGLVYTRAVASGVPHDLAQAMAAEFWDAETNQAASVEPETDEE